LSTAHEVIAVDGRRKKGRGFNKPVWGAKMVINYSVCGKNKEDEV